MKQIKYIINWFDTHTVNAYSVIRMFLGLILLIRAFIFLFNPSAITSIAGAQETYFVNSLIMATHLIGGLLLAIGYQTRIAAAMQIPILIGAVFFIHFKEGLISSGQSLELSILVLFLLFVYLLFGSGSYSLDYYGKQNKVLSAK